VNTTSHPPSPALGMSLEKPRHSMMRVVLDPRGRLAIGVGESPWPHVRREHTKATVHVSARKQTASDVKGH